MAVQQEKVYVAVGKDLHQGLGTLGWALRNWSSQSVSFVILHVSHVSKDFVYTSFGTLPISAVNDEMLEVFRTMEQDRVDKLLGKYMAFCNKVKAEVLKIERSDESIHNTIIELISSLHIRKLAMGITFTKSLTRKVKDETSIPYYVHKHKPEFCDIFMVCGGKLVFLREERDEGDYFEDEQGMMVADLRKKSKEKCCIKGWLGKILIDSSLCCTDHGSSRHFSLPPNMPEETSRWEDHCEEIENHIQWLLSSNPEGWLEEEDKTLSLGSMDQPKLETTVSDLPKGIEALKAKVEEAKKMAEEKKIEIKADVERRGKAERFTSLCNQWVEEIEASLKEEIAKQAKLKEEMDKVKDQATKVADEVAEKASTLESVLGLNKDLTMQLEASSWEKSQMEARLQKAVCAKNEMARQVEEIRRQRDMLFQKIKYYMQREAVAAADGSSCGYREFTAREVRDATDDFSECMMTYADTEGTLYRGVIGHITVAIQFKTEFSLQSPDGFKAQMEWLCKIRHPNVIAMIGACVDHRCIVFEYMEGGTLHDALFSASLSRRPTESVLLPWHARIRIAAEVASALGFLHSSRPHTAAHGRLSSSLVFLDRHLSAKIAGLRRSSSSAAAAAADVAALGALVLQLLTGREAAAGEEVRRAIGRGNLMGILDRTAGDWPLDLAADFAWVGLRCAATSEKDGDNEEGQWTAGMVRALEDLKKRAEERRQMRMGEGHQKKEQEMPNAFLCPILQEVMKQPHVAADGFSYELEAIKEWLDGGHETSPMTNLKLNHKHLMSNHTLRSLIYNWQRTNQFL
ncbi:putative U-box domain-containing protein 50 isoform X2 [Elaeis guineensis]|uniref:RING-type E3 ubiquitin transferase n=1 Tax=Elaeis guineensis var. tenera TaxID=51953 RepID=A0A8N4EVM1_ELAGV|nr:putative U-box domain-containing protein 50 isoform X2 [Elaeis guineensis]